jgi:2-dehydro-3-deoxyglucarate aldolase/4-hydroxy-2-oxoheptanedioate aldolase
MIESEAAVSAIDDIAAVDGVGMLLLGCADLSLDMRLPGGVGDPRLREIALSVATACRRQRKALGIGGASAHPELAKAMIEAGARFLLCGSDLSMLAVSARAQRLAAATLAASLYLSNHHSGRRL